jgi:hypothetical protein
MEEQQNATGSDAGTMGIVSRFFGSFFFPGRLFGHLAQRPVWFWMAALAGLLGGLLNFLVFSTEAGRNGFRQQMAESGRAIPPEGVEQAITIAQYGGSAGALVLTPVFGLIIAGIAYLIFNVVLGGEGSFRQALAICSHLMPIGILQGAVRVFLILQKETFQATTSFAAFAPFLESDSPFLLLLKGIDPFWIWQIGLLALGMSIIHRLPARKCAVVLFSTYAVVLVIVVLVSRLFT